MPSKINLDIVKLKELHLNGMSNSEISREFNVDRNVISRALMVNSLTPNKARGHKHTEEMKKHLSIKRKKYLKENPDKHPWRNGNIKFKSKPSEKIKEWLDSKNIQYISEYTEHGVFNRNFSIDIAMPDKMIALEVNGNQHYNRDGTLKDYYLEREKLLESTGWKVYQLHYSMCFKIDKLETLLLNLIESPNKMHFDYRNYTKPIKESNKCVDCGLPIYTNSKRCEICAHVKIRKVVHPNKETLHILIWKMSLVKIGKLYGVSDNAVRMWCKRYNLTFPNNKYWQNLRFGNITDYQI